MTSPFTVACVQNCAVPETAPNLDQTIALTRAAADEGADLVCLPEYFTGLDLRAELLLPEAFAEDAHPALPRFADAAAAANIWILLGSLAIEAGGGKVVNRSYLLDASGNVVRRYDKVHMFDVDLANGESYKESATIRPGAEAVVAETPWGPLGMTVCYDLRFPHLSRALAQAGARYLTVPAAFTKTTGEAHWHVLLRARAIENTAFVFAPCQCGAHIDGRASYGHSLIIDPWGRVIAEGDPSEVGYIVAEVDPALVDKARAQIPSLGHDRPISAPLPAAAAVAAE